MSAATCSTFERVRPDTATRAPAAARACAVPAPMPWPAPVTMATRPSSLSMLILPTWSSAGALRRRAFDVLSEQIALQQVLGRAGERDLSPAHHVGGRRDGQRPRSELGRRAERERPPPGGGLAPAENVESHA